MLTSRLCRWYPQISSLMQTTLQQAKTNRGVLSELGEELEAGAEKVRVLAESVLSGKCNAEKVYDTAMEWDETKRDFKLPRQLTKQEATAKHQIDLLKDLIISRVVSNK